MNLEQNSILVLSMIDRLQSENFDELLIKRLINTSDETKELNFNGCYGVINRQHTINCSLKENDNEELKWFNQNIFQYIPDSEPIKNQIIEHLTVSKLLQAMDQLYNRYIKTEWKPRIIKSIQEKIDKLNNEYKELGVEDIDQDEINEYLYDKIVDEYIERIVTSKMKSNNSIVKELSDFCYDTKRTFEWCPYCKKNILEIYNPHIRKHILELVENNYIGPERKFMLPNIIMEEFSKYKNFNTDFINNFIEDLFIKDKKFVLNRFQYIKECIIKNISQSFKKIADDKFSHFLNIAEILIYTNNLKALDSEELSDLTTCIHKINDTYKSMIIYPWIISININYDNSNYIETQETIDKRISIKEALKIANEHLLKIQSL